MKKRLFSMNIIPVMFMIVFSISQPVYAGAVRLINPTDNKETAILKLIDKDDWLYTVEAKAGETTAANIPNGTYRWLVECPKGTIVGGEAEYKDGKWHILSKVVISDEQAWEWVVKTQP